MVKIKVGSTYGFADFITTQEQRKLLEWTRSSEPMFSNNGHDGKRRFGMIYDDRFPDAPVALVQELRQRIIEADGLKDHKPETKFRDFIGINFPGGFIHTHTDRNDPPYVHTRYNIILSYPYEGGDSIYGGEVNQLQERLAWKCIAGKVMHGSTPVVGNKPRITLSLGFFIND